MSDPGARSLPIADCWNVIGVKGDHSCKRLEEVQTCQHCPVLAEAAQAFLDRPAPDGYANEATELLAQTSTRVSEPASLSVVVFEIGDQALCIDTTAVVEVAVPRPVHRVPHRTSRIFSGLVNVHGQLELCASLRGLLQIASAPAKEADRARMLLVERSGQRWVFGVDAVCGVHRFASSAVSELPATAAHDGSSYVLNILRWEERRVGHLDIDKTLSALDRSLR
jgi:chemotaxis-related protein WspD